MALVVVSEWIDGAALERLRERHEVVADAALHAQRARLFEALARAEALVVRNQTRVDAELLDAAPRLRVIGRVGVGLDTIDVAAATARDVVVSWAPGTNAASVAEYVIGAIVALARRFGPATLHVVEGGWQRQAFMGREVAGATLGIVGLGDIGARVARRARALGMHLLGSDPVVHASSAVVQEFGVELVSFDALLERSDAVADPVWSIVTRPRGQGTVESYSGPPSTAAPHGARSRGTLTCTVPSHVCPSGSVAVKRRGRRGRRHGVALGPQHRGGGADAAGVGRGGALTAGGRRHRFVLEHRVDDDGDGVRRRRRRGSTRARSGG
jgi:hypothetical protein